MQSPRKVFYNFRNNLYMLWKNYSTASLILRLPIRFILDIIAAWKALLAGKPKEWAAIAKAHLHFIRNLPKLHRKRREIQKVMKVTHEPNTMFNYSIVWQYYLKGIKVFEKLPGN